MNPIWILEPCMKVFPPAMFGAVQSVHPYPHLENVQPGVRFTARLEEFFHGLLIPFPRGANEETRGWNLKPCTRVSLEKCFNGFASWFSLYFHSWAVTPRPCVPQTPLSTTRVSFPHPFPPHTFQVHLKNWPKPQSGKREKNEKETNETLRISSVFYVREYENADFNKKEFPA